MQQILAVINQKGGVGKSTTAHALGAGLRARRKKVLFVDLDAQGNLSYTLEADPAKPTATDILIGGTAAAEAVQKLPEGDLIPSSPSLAGADIAMTEPGREYRLKKAIEPLLGSYDYVIIDTPPALGVLTINALTAATAAIIPAQADIYSLQGIGQLHGTISAVKEYTNPGLSIMGILLTRYNARAVLSRDIAELIEDTAKQLDTKVFKARIREGIAVKEAQASRRDIFTYAPKSGVAADYEAFIREVLKK